MDKKISISAALGAFDGIHIAHKKVLQNALDMAEKAVCITFKNLPKTKKGGILIQSEMKEKMLFEMGFWKVVVFDFDEIKEMSPKEFLDSVREKYGITHFSCGYNYHFGYLGAGDVNFLQEYCNKNGLGLKVETEILQGEDHVSSTVIREYLKEGKIERALELLGHPLEIKSAVVHGEKRGRTIGFPTINQPLPDTFAYMKYGVYETSVIIGDKEYKAITNLGIRPTFRLNNPICETYIIDFEKEIYGEQIILRFKRFIREERKFNSLNELRTQLDLDIEKVK